MIQEITDPPMTVKDMFSGIIITLPMANTDLRYDFHFTKCGQWFYIDSSDDIDHQDWQGHKEGVIAEGENWRVVETATAKIMASSAKELEDRG